MRVSIILSVSLCHYDNLAHFDHHYSYFITNENFTHLKHNRGRHHIAPGVKVMTITKSKKNTTKKTLYSLFDNFCNYHLKLIKSTLKTSTNLFEMNEK